MAESILVTSPVRVHNKAHSGYRRAGMAFDKGKNTLPENTITANQLAQLQADALLEVVLVEDAVQEAPTLSATSDTQSDEDLVDGGVLASVRDAIGLLDQSDSEHFTASGKPKTDALSELMQRTVSGSERDEAWQSILDGEQE